MLGVVQGLTEFLPVSSTAHLILARAFFGFDGDKFGLSFDVALHVGTLLALLVYFRTEVFRMIEAVPRLMRPREDQWAWMIWLLVVGTIPAGIVGLLFNRIIEEELRTVPVIIVTLAVVGLGLFWAERAGDQSRSERTLTLADAVWIGCAQALALIPGVSRSGATLIAALLLGLRRKDAAEFIFLLSIPAILAAAVGEAPKMLRGGEAGGEAALLAAGIVASAIVGYFAVKYFIRYVATHSLDVFAWYRLALAGAALVWMLR